MKYFRLIGIFGLLIFSFYLTDLVTNIALNTSPIMKEIKKESNNYTCKSVNATIENNTIIPGIKGKVVNEIESFLKMKDFGSFNNNYLIYDYIKPDVSIEDNKDKVIISGNKTLRHLSILIKDNNVILKYLNDNNIKYSKLTKVNDELLNDENINIENDTNKFNNLNSLLNKKNINKKICIINFSNIEECKRLKYYIVSYSYEITNSNIYEKVNNLNSGDIILIDNNLTLENFKVFINATKTKDLEFKYLSEIIKE